MQTNKQHIILKKIKEILQFSNYTIIQFLTAYFLLFTCYSFSQTITKSISEKVPSRFSDYDIIGKNNLGVVVHYFGNNESELVTYDDKLRVVNRRELPFNGKGISLESFVLLDNKVLVFYTTNSDSYQYLKVKELDEKLNIPNEVYILDSIPMMNVGNGKSFYVKTSPDKSTFMVFNIIQAKNSYFIKFQLYNQRLFALAKNIFTITDINPNDFSLKSMKVNNVGNVVGVVGHKSNLNNSDYDFDKFVIFTYNINTKTIGELELSNPNYQYKNVISEVSTKRDIVYISACYQSTLTKNDIGIVSKIVDFRNNNELQNSKITFNEDVLMKSQNYDFKAWQDKAALIKPKRIIPRSDGGFVLVTEGEYKFTKVERTNINNNSFYYNPAPYSSSVRYIDQNHYYDISVFSVNIDGTVDWQANMPKSQVSENDEGYYSSFAFFEANNVLKFLFNEDFYNSGNFAEYNVNPNGLLKRQSVFNTEKLDLVLVPMKAKQLDGNTIIFPSEQKRNLQFVLFQY
ncbi:MAG: hypothetical protein IPL21_04350 [Saprospirales bacterium]|nr:hypothetical protein [Saprospirales bacterium]